MDDLIIATNPGEMVLCQESLIKWCDGRLTTLATELMTAEQNYEQAKAAKWRSKPWQAVIRRAKRRIQYYEKVKAALLAGYYIVPPFPTDTIAIRTDARKPAPKTSSSFYDTHAQSARLLPAGEGRYVSDLPEVHQRQIPGKDREGNDKVVTEYFAKEFQPVDFPFKMVRPEIIDATNKAMTMKVFDRIGVLPAQAKRDPIVTGHIDWPGAPSSDRSRSMTFFIAWWLPLEGF